MSPSGTRRTPRHGLTLVELLVAMALAGLVATFVAGWIVHASRQAAAADRRDDREQELALLRNALFQDGTRGRTIELGRTRWKLARVRPGAEPDTVEWTLSPEGLRREDRQNLSKDTVAGGGFVPHFAGMTDDWDAWTQADRDFDGLVDLELLPRLDRLELRLEVVRRSRPGESRTVDTLRLQAPLAGPG